MIQLGTSVVHLNEVQSINGSSFSIILGFHFYSQQNYCNVYVRNIAN